MQPVLLFTYYQEKLSLMSIKNSDRWQRCLAALETHLSSKMAVQTSIFSDAAPI